MQTIPQNNAEQQLLYKKVGDSENDLLFFPPTKPGDGPAPVLVMIPGGGWQRNTSVSMYNMAKRTADRLREQGFAAVALSYRGQQADGVHMAEITADILDAMGYLARHREALYIDPMRLCAIGHSAGAHLALQAAYMPCDALGELREYADERFAVKAVVGLAPPTLMPFENSAFYTPIDLTPLFSEQTEAEYRRFSPIEYVTPATPPTMLATGTKDNLVLPVQADLLYQKLKRAGVAAKLLVSRDANHGFEPLAPDAGPELPAILDESADFLLSYT